MFPGGLNNLTIRISRNEYFCKMWDIPEPDEKEIENGRVRREVIEDKYFKDMSDAELVLRFFAYRQIDQWQGNTMEFFLDEFLQKGNKQFNKDVLNHLEELFNDTVKFAFDLFGKKAFWLHRNRENKWFHYERPTKILYDPLMQVLSNNLDNKEKILAKKQEVISGLENFHKAKYDSFKGRDTNKTKVLDRIEVLNEYLNSIINE